VSFITKCRVVAAKEQTMGKQKKTGRKPQMPEKSISTTERMVQGRDRWKQLEDFKIVGVSKTEEGRRGGDYGLKTETRRKWELG